MSLDHKTYSTGGNAALMANRLAVENCDVLLGGAVGTTLATLLHPAGVSQGVIGIPTVPTVKVVKDDSIAEVKDEIHLIMEYHLVHTLHY